METRNTNLRVLVSIFFAVTIFCISTNGGAAGLGMAFTYQGQLNDGGSPADGEYDFEFRLFDDPNGPGQVGSTVAKENVVVDTGIFTVQLDFGNSVFTGEARWLEIGVRPGAETGDFTPLSPRQELKPTPYALYAVNGPGSTGFWAANGNNIYNTNSGFVGINRSDTVTGAEYFGIQVPVQSGYGGMYIRSDGSDGWPFYGYRAGADAAWTYLNGSTGDWHLNVKGDRLTVTDEGYVGIGTTIPQGGLHVSGEGGAGTALFERSGKILALNPNYGDYNTFAHISTAQGSGMGLKLDVNEQTAITITPGGDLGGGNVGIGTTSPHDGKLVVANSAPDEAYISLQPDGEANNDFVGLRATESGNNTTKLHLGREFTYDAEFIDLVTLEGSTGDVGIGTTDPGGAGFDPKLDVRGGFAVSYSGPHGATALHYLNGDPSGDSWLATGATSKVGIGTTAPASKLHVNGTFTVTGTASVGILEINGADVAEKFPVSEEAGPGMVMIINPKNPGQLCLSRKAYDRCVAGVVSGANDLPCGAVLGNLPGSEEALPIALSGRVWVYCDAGTDAIEPGDLLTTSHTPGHAMKVTDTQKAFGTVLGKAMSPLKSGKGLVLVLVNLQ